MASNLECIGLLPADEDEFVALLNQAAADGDEAGHDGSVRLVRWTDPSGARLVVGVDADGTLVELLPSFAGRPGAILGEVVALGEEVSGASVYDGDGEQVSALALELEQRRVLAASGGLPSQRRVPAALVALGVEVRVHGDAAAFEASDHSLLSEEGRPGPDGGPPLRVAAESFLSYGVFAEPHEASAYARLSGTVLASSRREVRRTGQVFHAARVRTVGVEVDVCLPGTEHAEPPAPGAVVSGTVFMVGSLELP